MLRYRVDSPRQYGRFSQFACLLPFAIVFDWGWAQNRAQYFWVDHTASCIRILELLSSRTGAILSHDLPRERRKLL